MTVGGKHRRFSLIKREKQPVARVLMRLNNLAIFIVNANHSIV